MSIRVRPLILFIIVAITFFSACRKDPAPPVAASSHVRSETLTSSSGIAFTIAYTYDSPGRQTASQTDSTITRYVYTSDSVIQTITVANRHFVSAYILGAEGRATSDTRGFIYTYDAAGYLILSAYTPAGSTDSTICTISAGNVTLSAEHQQDSATNNLLTTTYTYLSARDTRDYGMAYKGRANTSLISTQNIVQVINGSTYSSSYSYTYSYDQQGRVSRQVRSSGSATYTTTYTY
jgi:hypothetical protein